MSPARKVAILVGSVAALAGLATLLPLSTLSSGSSAAGRTLAEQVADLGPLGVVGAVLLGTVLLVALVPRTPLSVVCGLLFGPVLGIITAIAMALLASVITFAAGRWLGRDFLLRHARGRLTRFEQWVSRQDALSIAAVRTLPVGPYGLAGYSYGATGLPVRSYVIGTLIAAPPSAVTYALLGAAVTSPGGFNPLLALPAAVGLVIVGILAVRWRRTRKAAAGAAAAGAAAALSPSGSVADPPVPAPSSSR
jgi:uncharacterized membrane protein YdjX (TVP38/TMEM64 family)